MILNRSKKIGDNISDKVTYVADAHVERVPSVVREKHRIRDDVFVPDKTTQVALKNRSPKQCQEALTKTFLEKYDAVEIPKETTLILKSFVFDGIGDLDHLLLMTRCMRKRFADLAIVVWLEKGRDVPEKAWRAKYKEIKKIDSVTIYQTKPSLGCTIETTQQSVLRKKLAERKNACCLFVSSHAHYHYPPYGITEYLIDLFGTEKYKQLKTGIACDAMGIWLSDDPVFCANTAAASHSLRKILYGAKTQQRQWDVGFASLRSDVAKISWIALRLLQMQQKNCSLVVSSFEVNHDVTLIELAQCYGFDGCFVVNEKRKETCVFKSPRFKILSKILRIVHCFVDEKDMPALYRIAKSGSIGCSGDHGIARSLLGEFPMFIDTSIHQNGSDDVLHKVYALKMFVSEKYPKLNEWITALIEKNYTKLHFFLQDVSLLMQWQHFCRQVFADMDLGVWVERFVKYCVTKRVTRSWLEK